jgi:membrane associated rhomboid family serine protease
MGIYDRGYMQDDEPNGFRFTGGTRTLVTNIIIVTVAIALADLFTPGSEWLSQLLALPADLLREPWKFWTLLTYGFAHAPIAQSGGIWHVGMNMFVLWMFGRTIESRLGRSEFLYFYLIAIVFSGLFWLVGTNLWLATSPTDGGIPTVFGASGAVTAVFMLFILYYPHQTLYLFGAFAIPAWVLGLIIIGSDVLRAVTGTAGNVAWQAHIGGVAFAYLYARFHWQFTRILPALGSWPKSWQKPRLKIHAEDEDVSDLDAEGDRILDKLLHEGDQSLTRRERRILEKYSRRMREKRNR